MCVFIWYFFWSRDFLLQDEESGDEIEESTDSAAVAG